MTYDSIMKLADAYAKACVVIAIGGDESDRYRARNALSIQVKELTDTLQWAAEEIGHDDVIGLLEEFRGAV